MRHRTAVIAAAGAVLAAAPVALAHTDLFATSPAAGARVATAPRVVTLTFTGAVGRVDRATVVRAGRNYATSARLDPRSNRQVRVTLRRIRPAGAYTVRWSIRSADGHPESGVFSFRARRAAP